MFERIGRFTVRYRWLVIAAWLLAVAATLPILPRSEQPLEVGGFSADQSETGEVGRVLELELRQPPSSLVIVYQSETLAASDPQFQDQVSRSVLRMRHLPIVSTVILPGINPAMISADDSTAYAIVGLNLPISEAQRRLPEIEAALESQPDISAIVAGGPAFYADIETASQRDLRRAEVIAFPVAMIALLLVFGTVVSACIPLIVGSAGVAVVILLVYWLAHVVQISIFALNLSTMLGLGLAVDYSLFITSRFREELPRRDGDVDDAVVNAIAVAGRAVFFSGFTVMIGLAGLIAFPLMFLRSIGYAGVIVVGVSCLAALTLLPAVLAVIGHRIERFAILPGRRKPEETNQSQGFWSWLAHRVMRRPVIFAVAATSLLLLLGLPFLRANISSPDATILPTDLPSRQGYDILAEEFGGGEISPFVIVLQSNSGTMDSAANLEFLDAMSRRLEADPAIARVESAVNISGPGAGLNPIQRVAVRALLEQQGTDTQLSRFLNENVAMILAFPVNPANDLTNKELLAELRAMPDTADVSILVGGGTGEIVDVVDAIYADFPVVVAMIIGATYLVLMTVFRSVVLPLKAIVMNVLSILASYGALVWIFQDGHFHRWLDFQPQGFVEASLPVITFCVLFGLSMDYEVFLLSRVQEEWLRTGDNSIAVANGMQRSGRIITSAALIVVVVTASFVTAEVVLVKALGLGIALAVAVDATIVRAILVPSTMKLLGRWNWWMPGWLERRIPGALRIE